jgi:hypothetical protein
MKASFAEQLERRSIFAVVMQGGGHVIQVRKEGDEVLKGVLSELGALLKRRAWPRPGGRALQCVEQGLTNHLVVGVDEIELKNC